MNGAVFWICFGAVLVSVWLFVGSWFLLLFGVGSASI